MLPAWVVLIGMLVVLVGLPLWYATMRPLVRTSLLLGHIAVLQVIPGTLIAPYAFRLPGGLLLTPANVIVSAVFMAAVVLVMVERRATIVRLAVLVVVVAGLVEVGLLASTNWALSTGTVEPFLEVDADVYGSFLGALLAGTPLVVVELLLFVVVTERLGSVVSDGRRAAVAYVGVFGAILVLDGVLFTLVTGLLEPGLTAQIAGGVARKLVLAVAFGVPLLGFVLVQRVDVELAGERPPLSLRDVLLAPRHELVARLERRERERVVLLERTLHVAEEERRRLAEDLHDDAIQLLTAADIHLQRIAAATPEVDVEKVRQLVRSGVGSLRRLILELRAPEVTATGFEPLVRSYVDRIVPTGTPVVELHVDLPSDVPEEVVSGAFRIVLESLSNAVRHADATDVRVDVVVNGRRLVGEVVDDGSGIPHDAETGPGHLGLRAMRDRADVLGGRIDVRAMADGGTRVAFELPIGPMG